MNEYKAYFRPRNPATKVLWPAGRVSQYGEPLLLDVGRGGFDQAMEMLLANSLASHLEEGDTVVLLNTDEYGGLRVYKLRQEPPVVLVSPLTWVAA